MIVDLEASGGKFRKMHQASIPEFVAQVRADRCRTTHAAAADCESQARDSAGPGRLLE